MNNSNTIHKRIELARIRTGMSRLQLAKIMNVSPQTVHAWETGQATPRTSRLINLAKALMVKPLWLQADDIIADTQSVDDGLHAIPLNAAQPEVAQAQTNTHTPIYMYDISLTNDDFMDVEWLQRKEEEPIYFRNTWFTSRHINPDNLRAIRAQGDSMSPMIDNQDIVLIDTEDKIINDGEVYAVIFDGSFYLKKVRKTAAEILLISINPAWETISIPIAEKNKLNILGRKVWRGG